MPKSAGGTTPGRITELRIAVLSDLHVCEGPVGGRHPSLLRVSDPENRPSLHPIAGLEKLIKDHKLKADLLLCPGDFGDRALQLGIKYAWERIHGVARWLSCREVAATAGNHDLDSRYVNNKYDPTEYIRSLRPNFPVRNATLSAQYWANHFTILRKPNYRLLVLNSCAYHGGPEAEKDHGRISEQTLDRMKESLEAYDGEPPVNLLLCHHHPQQHQELRLGDYDVMKNGQLLLDMLGGGDYGDWLITHGHKHHPKLCYASGGASSPVIFSAGSLSVDIQQDLQGYARNQFYLIRIPTAAAGDQLKGSIDAWDWSNGVGWIPAGPSSGLPSRSGFGCRDAPQTLAAKIADLIGSQRLMLWEAVIESIQDLLFVIPKDVAAIQGILKRRHQIDLVIRDDGMPYQIGKTAS
jgi:predicted MPP superfamily phosphohydrolase